MCEEILPYEMPCPKCGGDDIHLQHRDKKEEWQMPWGDKFSNVYAKDESGWVTAKREHLEHHCRTCSFGWQTLPLK